MVDPITIGLVLGAAGTGMNIMGGISGNKAKKKAQKAAKKARMRQAQFQLNELDEQEKDYVHSLEGPLGERRNLEESIAGMSDDPAGMLRSGIANTQRGEFDHQKKRRLEALERKRQAIRAGVMDSNEMFKIQSEMDRNQYYMNILNTFMSQGVTGFMPAAGGGGGGGFNSGSLVTAQDFWGP